MKKLMTMVGITIALLTVQPVFGDAGDLTVDFVPDTLNLASSGNYITCKVTSSTVSLADILENAEIIGTIPAVTSGLPIAPESGTIAGGQVVLKFNRALVQAVCSLDETTLILGWGEPAIFDTATLYPGGFNFPSSRYLIEHIDLTGASYMNLGETSGTGTILLKIYVGGGTPLVTFIGDISTLIEGSYLLPSIPLGDVTLEVLGGGTFHIDGIDFTVEPAQYGAGGGAEVSGSDTIRVINEGGKKN